MREPGEGGGVEEVGRRRMTESPIVARTIVARTIAARTIAARTIAAELAPRP